MLAPEDKRIILAVDLDYFYAQAEEVRNPELKGKPLVVCVYSGRTETSGAVSTANYLARSLGVKSGIPIASAQKILANRPDAVFIPMDSDYYDSVSVRIMSMINSYSEAFEQVSIDEAFIDITERTKGKYAQATKEGMSLKKEIYVQERLTSSVGIGPNKLVAKMAVDFEKPNGLTVVEPSKVQEFLFPMQVRKLFGVGPKMEKGLKELGINSIGDLAHASESVLANQFGKNLGPELKRLAQGIDASPVKERKIEQLSRIITLKHDAETFDFKSELEPLCVDISKRLKSNALKCKAVGIIVITTQLKTRSRNKTLWDATDDSKVLLEKSSEEFQEFFDSEKEKARRIGIRVSSLDVGARKKESEEFTTLTDFGI